MDYTDYVNMAPKIGATRIEVVPTGYRDWTRIFVIRGDGCTIGRISYDHISQYGYVKWYKDKVIGYCLVDESDEIQARYMWLKFTGTVMSRSQYLRMLETSKRIAKEQEILKKTNRDNLPKYRENGTKIRRKALSPVSPRNTLFLVLRLKIQGFNRRSK